MHKMENIFEYNKLSKQKPPSQKRKQYYVPLKCMLFQPHGIQLMAAIFEAVLSLSKSEIFKKYSQIRIIWTSTKLSGVNEISLKNNFFSFE